MTDAGLRSESAPDRSGAALLRRLVRANALSAVGDGARYAGLPLLAAEVTDGDPFRVSVVAAAGRAAWLLAPVIGTLVDRMPGRRAMVGADLARCLMLALLGVLATVHAAPVAVLVPIAFVSGIAEIFFDGAAQAIVPALAADHELEPANARIIAAQITGTGFLGPPLGAALWAVWQPLPFLLDALTFLGSAALLRSLPTRAWGVRADGDERARRGIAGVLRDSWAGLALLARHMVFRRLMVVVAVLGIGQQAVYAILVVYVERRLGLPSYGYSLMLVAAALGSLAGARTAARAARRLGTRGSLVLSVSGSAMSYLVVAVLPWWPLVGIMLAVNSAAVVLWNVCTVSLRQRLAPADMLGRVISGYRLAAWGTMPLGAALGGTLARREGLDTPWLMAGVLLLACLPLLRGMTAPAATAPPGSPSTTTTKPMKTDDA
ncbi:MFS transporter [Streptomyces sp. NPDC003393]